MSATGLDPGWDEWCKRTRVQVRICVGQDRLDEFDRLMTQGGIEAVVAALRKEQAKQGL